MNFPSDSPHCRLYLAKNPDGGFIVVGGLTGMEDLSETSRRNRNIFGHFMLAPHKIRPSCGALLF